MAKIKSIKSSQPLKIQLHAKSMLSGPKLMMVPFWALNYGGMAEGLVLNQLLYLSNALEDWEDEPSVTISYSRLQKHLPFFSRRWLIEIISRLESMNTIKVNHTGRINEIEVMKKYEKKVEWTNYNVAKLLIFPELACKVGLLEAIALQQIHIRHHDSDGSMWVIRSLKKWHEDTFMFLGEATVKRLFRRLKVMDLIYVKDYYGEFGLTKSYRVNYLKIVEVLGISIPDVWVPANAPEWINPLYPLLHSTKKIVK